MSIQMNENDKTVVLENGGDFREYEQSCEDKFRQCGLAGSGCLKNDNRMRPVFPEKGEMLRLADGSRHLTITTFDLDADGELTVEGMRMFKSACRKFQSECDAYEKNGNGDLTRHFLHTLSTDIRLSLGLRQDWTDACNEPINNNFVKWRIIKSIYSAGTSKLRNNRFRQFLSLKQDTNESFSAYADKVHNGALSMVYNFGSTAHPGYIKVDDIKLLVFLTGLHQVDFKFFLDKWYVDHPDGTTLTADEVMTSAAIYARENVEEPSKTQYAVSLVVKSEGTKCVVCNTPIADTISKFNGRPWSKCTKCFQKVMNDKAARTKKKTEDKLANFASMSAYLQIPKPGPIVPKPSQSTRTALRANIVANPTVDLTEDDSSDDASEDD